MEDLTSSIASRHLGKHSDGSQSYDPSLLVAIPRQLNRAQYGLEENSLPFGGFDIWQAYEFSCLTEKGLPVSCVIKLSFPYDSPCLVESKSLKLYLNSFNMTRIGQDCDQCIRLCLKMIENDLSKALETVVRASVCDEKKLVFPLFEEAQNLFSFIDESSFELSRFKEDPSLLEISSDEKTESFVCFHGLRSNCRVTHQPDFGSVFVYYRADHHLDEASLVKYLVSFRNEYHFHEECCEMIFKRLLDVLDPSSLMVLCMYTRRGGIDINPVRFKGELPSFIERDIKALENLRILAKSGIRQ